MGPAWGCFATGWTRGDVSPEDSLVLSREIPGVRVGFLVGDDGASRDSRGRSKAGQSLHPVMVLTLWRGRGARVGGPFPANYVVITPPLGRRRGGRPTFVLVASLRESAWAIDERWLFHPVTTPGRGLCKCRRWFPKRPCHRRRCAIRRPDGDGEEGGGETHHPGTANTGALAPNG